MRKTLLLLIVGLACATPQRRNASTWIDNDSRDQAWYKAVWTLKTKGYPIQVLDQLGGRIEAGPKMDTIECGLLVCDAEKFVGVKFDPNGDVRVDVTALIKSHGGGPAQGPWTEGQARELDREQDEILGTITARGDLVDPNLVPAGLSGCTRDTECKGDRICQAGRCVDPPPAAPGPR